MHLILKGGGFARKIGLFFLNNGRKENLSHESHPFNRNSLASAWNLLKLKSPIFFLVGYSNNTKDPKYHPRSPIIKCPHNNINIYFFGSLETLLDVLGYNITEKYET